MASESAKRIAGAIVLAGALVAFVPIVHQTIQEARMRRELSAMAKEETAASQEVERQAAIAAYRRAPTALRSASRTLWLRDPEQCVSGTIVRTITTPTRGYVQLLENGQPVRCAGRRRL